jgi:enoyl-CoA hydratase/carnithine racemase
MSFVVSSKSDGIAAVRIDRGKVNALNVTVISELHEVFRGLETDDSVRSVILRGTGSFFSFGFDIPECLSYSKNEFEGYVDAFTEFYRYLFRFPKPVVAALSGHAVGGGCVLAIACDHRLMIEGKAKIALHEIGFGLSVFAGVTAILVYCIGSKKAQELLFSGRMYSAREALQIGLVDEVVQEEVLEARTLEVAREYAGRDSAAFSSIKDLLRAPVSEQIALREKGSIKKFLDIWYSENTWENLRKITIRS